MSWETGLRKVCDGYNMIDTAMVVKECKSNPGAECGKLKEVCHNALRQGRDNVLSNNLVAANSNFALAYQARCVCDYIWKNVLLQKGDETHAAFLQKSRDFSKFATDGLVGNQKTAVEKLIAKIK